MRPKQLCSGADKFLIALLISLLLTTSAWAAQEEILHSFVASPHGANPQANLIADAVGNLYGTTPNGGKYGYGTVFGLTAGKNGKWSETILYSFTGGTDGANPVAGLVFDNAGNLYGVTAAGGITSQECYYSYSESSCGVVFELSPGTLGTWRESVLYSFNGYPNDGQTPITSLIFDNAGHLYGTTDRGGAYAEGTVFELSPGSNGVWIETILYDFTGSTDGAGPGGSLILDSVGNLYGTTAHGGEVDCGCGTIFELTPNGKGTWTEAVLHSFTYDDGAYPSGGLVFDSVGNLYGTTTTGPGFACADGGCGTVFRLTPGSDGTWTQTMIYNFEGGPDGFQPAAGLVLDGAGNLYGTTEWGGGLGSCSCGTVFELTPRSKGKWTERVIHRFGLPAQGQNDGIQPMSSLFLDQAGNLYGTTMYGGDESCYGYNTYGFTGCGAVFKLSPASGGKWTPSLLYVFKTSPLGTNPVAGVVSDSAGNLYGTTQVGGADNYGVAFELTPKAGGGWKEIVLHTFAGNSDGTRPGSSLVSDTAGNLYGTTTNGGSRNCNGYLSCGGTVFELTPSVQGWKETVVYRFGENNNKGFTIPMAGVILDTAGNLYGTTGELGIIDCYYGCGTVYKLSPSGGGKWYKETLYEFKAGSDGWDPVSPLVFDHAGNLYGTTCEGGANGSGTVFKLAPNSIGKWTKTVLYSFGSSNDDGSCPFAGVVFDREGNLYGTTYQGGNYGNNCYSAGCGVVFELSPLGTSVWKETVLHRFHGELDGSNPETSLTMDGEGNLYGATPNDGTQYGGGAVFKLSRGSNGVWMLEVVHHFKSGARGGFCPVGPLIFDATGNIYGAASCGGTDGSGTVFELSSGSDHQWVDEGLAPPMHPLRFMQPMFNSQPGDVRFLRNATQAR
jgi:uncharacterized repeat protein (TIGR03803 family)